MRLCIILLCALSLLDFMVKATICLNGEALVTFDFSSAGPFDGRDLLWATFDGKAGGAATSIGNVLGGSVCFPSCTTLVAQITDLDGYNGNFTISVNDVLLADGSTVEDVFVAVQDIDCAAPTAEEVPLCPDGQEIVNVMIDIDENPEDTVWQIYSLANGTIASGEGVTGRAFGPGISATNPSTNSFGGAVACLTCGTPYTFSILDCAGNGICCDSGYGKYVVSTGENVLASGGEFSFSERTFFSIDCP